jgi:hypothetical protein
MEYSSTRIFHKWIQLTRTQAQDLQANISLQYFSSEHWEHWV